MKCRFAAPLGASPLRSGAEDAPQRIALFIGLAWLAGCRGIDSSPALGTQPPIHDASFDVTYEASAPAGPCDAVVQERPIEGFQHVAVCSYVEYVSKPPSSGDHYPIWAAYKSYPTPIPEGFWVHNLEHGSIVFSYDCPEGCEADVAAAQALIDALPDDPECTSLGEGVRRRSLMTPDPDLDVRFAASAWGWTLRAKCFDATAFRAFALAHYNHGREDLCPNGNDVATGLAPNCGKDP